MDILKHKEITRTEFNRTREEIIKRLKLNLRVGEVVMHERGSKSNLQRLHTRQPY
jgi:hypothetical protein